MSEQTKYKTMLITPEGETIEIKKCTAFKLPKDYQCEPIERRDIQGSFTFDMPIQKSYQRKMYEHQQLTGRPQRVLIAKPLPWE